MQFRNREKLKKTDYNIVGNYTHKLQSEKKVNLVLFQNTGK